MIAWKLIGFVMPLIVTEPAKVALLVVVYFTVLILKVASPNFATSKKSAEDKWPANFSPASSVIFIPATSTTKDPPTNLPPLTWTLPDLTGIEPVWKSLFLEPVKSTLLFWAVTVKVSTAFVVVGLLKENNAMVAKAKAELRMIFFIFVVLNF